MVRQPELGHDGIDFGIVLAGLAEHVDNLALGVLGIVGPVGDAHHGLVARLAAAKFRLGYIYVGGKELRVGEQVGEVAVDLEYAYECLLLTLNYVYDLGLGLGTLDTCGNGDLDPVAVEGVHRVALGHEDFFGSIVGDNAVLAVRAAHKRAHGLCRALRQSVFAGRCLHQNAVEGKLGKIHGHMFELGLCCQTKGCCDLAVIKRTGRVAGDICVDIKAYAVDCFLIICVLCHN